MSKLVPGQIVYVKVKNCHLLDKPAYDATVIAVLQPNAQVAWLAEAVKGFHQVKYGDLTGYIYFSSLSKEYCNPKYVPPKCDLCKGLGYLPVQGIDESQWRNYFIHPVCPRCGGSGTPKEHPVFATSGGTKA